MSEPEYYLTFDGVLSAATIGMTERHLRAAYDRTLPLLRWERQVFERVWLYVEQWDGSLIALECQQDVLSARRWIRHVRLMTEREIEIFNRKATR